MSNEHRASDVIVAFGAGALLGAAVALLMAPKSGADTRRELGDLAEGALERSRSMADQTRAKTLEVANTAGEFVRDQKERVGHAIHEGKEAYVRETAKR